MPLLTKNHYINFFGGEPLLAFDLIKKVTSLLDIKNAEFKKRTNYSLSTNGSLLTTEIIQFLDKHKFSVVLSFDGLAQNILREKESFNIILSNIKKLLKYSNINLEVNSVFSSSTVEYISESIKFICSLGVPNIRLSLSIIKPWSQASLFGLEKELRKVVEITLFYYEKNGNIPINIFREDNKEGIFYCAAGKDRMAITPGGDIWGCYLFPDYFKKGYKAIDYRKYFFGKLNYFSKNYRKTYPSILTNYSQLSMDNFYTSSMKCLLCQDLENCAVCPVNASFSGIPLGKIPDYACEIQKIKIREKERFKKEIQKRYVKCFHSPEGR